jgi:hypothetical protein
MRRFTRFLAAAAPLALILAAATPARADLVDVGVGVIGGVGGNFLDKPGDKAYPPFAESDPTSYPGFGGVNYGFGLALDVRLIKFLGLEVDLLKQKDRGHADWDFSVNNQPKQTYKMEIGQDAWHIPVLLKGVIPLPLLAPMAFLGIDFVSPGTPDASVTPSGSVPAPFAVKAHADSYKMLMGGIGFEIKLPIPGVDIRLPFMLRAALNTGTSDKLVDRQNIGSVPVGGDPSRRQIIESDYRSEWKYQAMATLGAQIFF